MVCDINDRGLGEVFKDEQPIIREREMVKNEGIEIHLSSFSPSFPAWLPSEEFLWGWFPRLMVENLKRDLRMELPAKEYLSPKELGQIFGVSPQAIRNLDGKLDPPLKPHRTKGGHRRYTQSQAQQLRCYFAS
jgi:hypothetical protein